MIGEWVLKKKQQKKCKRVNTYKEMVKFSAEITGIDNNSIVPGIIKVGSIDFKLMFKKMMTSKGYEYIKNDQVNKIRVREKRNRGKVVKTEFKGCYYEDKYNKYRAQVNSKGKTIPLGRFDTLEEAFEARRSYIEDNGLRNKI